MELRRALLLFAIVLGLAAIATSVSRPPDRDDSKRDANPAPAAPSNPTAETGPVPGGSVEVTFAPAQKPPTERVAAGRAATVVVEVDEPGDVELAGLGLTATAEPLTPARFEVLSAREGRHPVRITPSAGGAAQTLGTLEIGP